MNLKELANANKTGLLLQLKKKMTEVEKTSSEVLLRTDVLNIISNMEHDSCSMSYEYGQGGWRLPDQFKSVMMNIYDSGEIPESYVTSADAIAEWLWSTTFNRLKVCWALSNISKFETLDITKVGSCTDLGYQKGSYDEVMLAIKLLGYNPTNLIKLLKFDGYYNPSNLYHPYDEYEKCSSYKSRESWEREIKAHHAFITHDAFITEVAEVAEAL